MKRMAVCLLLFVLALSGCANKGPATTEAIDDVPEEIGSTTVSEIEQELAAKYPRAFSFPGQEALEPIQFVIDGVVQAGEGSSSAELPNDNGITDANPVYVRHDISEHVPNGQPAELRIKLKWFGNPGSSADLDIFADVPGFTGAHDPDSWDESLNWGVVYKFAVINTVRQEGRPFDLGVQVTNGKVISADMHYEMTVSVEYAEGVLAPGIPYAIDVPGNASRLVIESEPLGGDEHITGEYIIIGPDDTLLRHEVYNDIGNDARAVTVKQEGEYVLYAPHLRGGFLRVSTDVPNPGFEARALPLVEEVGALAEAVLPPTGGSGAFDVASFPLEMHAWLAPGGAPVGIVGNAALNLTSPNGWVTTTAVQGYAGGGDAGRVGNRVLSMYDNANLATGSFGWTVDGSAAVAMDAGYRLVTYTR